MLALNLAVSSPVSGFFSNSLKCFFFLGKSVLGRRCASFSSPFSLRLSAYSGDVGMVTASKALSVAL